MVMMKSYITTLGTEKLLFATKNILALYLVKKMPKKNSKIVVELLNFPPRLVFIKQCLVSAKEFDSLLNFSRVYLLDYFTSSLLNIKSTHVEQSTRWYAYGICVLH